MTTAVDARKALIDLLSIQAPAPVVAHLDGREWAGLLCLARQHRLTPLLHWRLTREKRAGAIPEDIRKSFAKDFKDSTLRALAARRELILTSKILAGAAIPSAALKGAFLAFHAYPHPALRPSRDIDLLVPREKALRAYEILQRAGFRRIEEHTLDPEYCLDSARHLPPLMPPSGALRVELHARLTLPRESATGWENGVWERLIERPSAGQTLRYLSPTDLLLHLIVHAAYEHRFDNGPLILSDLDYLIRGEKIDWTLFWNLACEGGWTKGCELLLKLTGRLHGASLPGIPDASIPEFDALALMLRDTKLNYAARLAGRLSGRSPLQKLSLLFRGALPSQSVGMTPRYWAARAKRVASRVPTLLSSARHPAARENAEALARLERWLST